jgi:hypothetical protein
VEELKNWYTPKIDGTAETDQEAVFSFIAKGPFRWKFIEVKPSTLVRWKCLEGPGASVGTTVTFRVSQKSGNETVVECDHGDWLDGDSAFKTCNTFWGILMGHLKDYTESGKAQPAFR